MARDGGHACHARLAAALLLPLAAPAASRKNRAASCRLSHFDSPASMSILEESTRAADAADDGRLQQPRHVRAACARRTACNRSCPDLATELVVERGRHRADLPAAPGRQMARRQAVHRQGRQMHLGSADGQGQREAARQPAQILVQQPRGGDHQRRLRGHLPPEAAAAVRCWRCSPPAGRRSIPAMCRRARCGSTRSAPARSNLSSSSRTSTIKVARNPDYWKPGRPYLDGIEYTIMREIVDRASWPSSPASST